ncbi:replicative DNA helicase loader DnaB [Bacillus oleivorans]|uniref:Replicative DNA helicase loader DnaB n=1 Tax=Bacillus oleivorans TaxID=1448271 RepID=A0A285CV59_9BACI|nr:DnaD domain protein [Bacillus oleivorans]SNX71450.1 replicative DNA helicase loader DnaB [Bacillus oleivorans]
MEARHWTELVPGDTYQIQSAGLIQPYFQKVTALLYQPLIGSAAISLYTTLWSELEENRTYSKQNHHHFLMAVLNIPLREIYQARLKLEGIGLLRTFRSKHTEGSSYVYELQSPLSPHAFFQDSMLSYFLFRKLGEHHFNRLKNYFRIDSFVDSSSFDEMTRSFHEVFASSPARAFPVQTLDDQEQWVDIVDGTAPIVKLENFSLDLFYGGLSDTFIKIDSITPKVEETVLKLAYVYSLSPLDMQKIILEAVDDDQEINLDELRNAAKSWYELKKGKHLPELVERVNQPKPPQKPEKKETKEEKLIRYLSSVSPKQLLTDLAHGHEPSKTDLALVESLIVDQGLEPGVINVLLYNVMLKQDMRLTKSYVQTIAGHWARKNIKTVEEAFAFAKQEHQKVQVKSKSPYRNQSQKKSGRKEVVPEWFEEERNRRNEVATSASIFEDFDFELERKRLEEELRKK